MNKHVKRAKGPRYAASRMPTLPPLDGNNRPRKNAIHSILTALPILMLLAGLYFYYRNESAQADNAPIRAESVTLTGSFSGMSKVKSGGAGQYFLWIDTDSRSRGARLRSSQFEALQSLQQGDAIKVYMAPSVARSTTFWLWRLEHGGVLLIDDEAQLR
ncbi:MAG: hypothetical protein V3U76_02345 [Granulosicoccus sp.]